MRDGYIVKRTWNVSTPDGDPGLLEIAITLCDACTVLRAPQTLGSVAPMPADAKQRPCAACGEYVQSAEANKAAAKKQIETPNKARLMTDG